MYKYLLSLALLPSVAFAQIDANQSTQNLNSQQQQIQFDRRMQNETRSTRERKSQIDAFVKQNNEYIKMFAPEFKNKDRNKNWSSFIIYNYMHGCVASAPEGIDKTIMQGYCGCTADYFRRDFTQDEFIAAEQRMNLKLPNEDFDNKFTEIINKCQDTLVNEVPNKIKEFIKK